MEQLPTCQYITHPHENFDNLSWITALAKGGLKWIQLRIKEKDFAECYPKGNYVDFFIENGKKIAKMCREEGILLTVNDHVEWVNEIGANGAHIGKEDISIKKVRAVLGHDAILGATVNTLEDCQSISLQHIHYLGLGPFATTTTKQKERLAPKVSIENYHKICAYFPAVPIFAIGGIEEKHICKLQKSGVYGIALSGAIFRAQHNPSTIKIFTQKHICT
jgi:thiamine-phosphate pyrophosphorylase